MQHRIAAHESARLFSPDRYNGDIEEIVLPNRHRYTVFSVPRSELSWSAHAARREIDGVRNGDGDDWGGE